MNAPAATILVVDDSEVCLEIAREALEAAGFTVVTSTTPLGASRLLRESNAACAVVDMTMPALSGDKLVEILRRATTTDVPILLHSDRPIVQLRAIARACGAVAAVPKTPSCDELVSAVKKVLGVPDSP